MKVTFLSKRYWPAVGGVERHLEFLCAALLTLRSDLELTIITEQHDASLPTEEVKDGVKIYRIPLLPNTTSPNLKKSIWSWVKSHHTLMTDADVVHVHDVFYWLRPLQLRLRKPKVFTTFHGYEPPSPTWKQKFQHQIAELFSDGSIGIGGFHQKWYGVEPTLISFGAVELAEIDIKKKRKLSDTKKILFVGRLEEETGIWLYLEALAEIQKTSKQRIQLDVVGDGPLRFQLEKFVEQEKLPVKFLGWQRVTTSLYQDYELSLVSRYLSIVESLAAGVPVLSTYTTAIMSDYLRISPFAEWISIQPPGEKLQLALLTEQKLSKKAQDWALKQTWEKMANLYLQLWSKP